MTHPIPGYQRWFAELKRRRVFRVMAVYGATAFILLQAADLLAEGMGLSNGVLRVATFFVLIGFPIAIVLAWAFESTPEGIRRTQGAAESDAALAEAIEKYEQDGAYNIAYVLAFRGEADRAFEWLDKAVRYHDSGLSDIAQEPLFANIHDDPRWLPFLESIGKSPVQLAAIGFRVTLPK